MLKLPHLLLTRWLRYSVVVEPTRCCSSQLPPAEKRSHPTDNSITQNLTIDTTELLCGTLLTSLGTPSCLHWWLSSLLAQSSPSCPVVILSVITMDIDRSTQRVKSADRDSDEEAVYHATHLRPPLPLVASRRCHRSFQSR